MIETMKKKIEKQFRDLVTIMCKNWMEAMRYYSYSV